MTSPQTPLNSGYHRPHERFQCGHAKEGRSCASGPRSDGTCSSSSGNCDPTHRLPWWLRHFRALLALSGICFIAIAISSPWHRDLLAPGPLTQAHGQLLEGPSRANRCAACHDQGRFPAIAWISPAHPMAGASTAQSELCSKCHLNDLPGLATKTPHDLPREELEAITKRIRQVNGNNRSHLVSAPADAKKRLDAPKSVAGSQISWRSHELACSDCHREHQGAGHDLKSMTMARCQSCHVGPFASFASGHPEFQSYPKQGDSAIAFDHLRHRDLHFSKESKTFDCSKCHVQEARGAVGQVFRSVSFENACASCHQKPLENSLVDGVVVFQLPSVDRKKLQEQQRDEADLAILRAWPEASSQMMDGAIPPVMELLLAGDDEGKRLLEFLPESGSLADVDLSKAKNGAWTVRLLDASKQLLAEIARDGQKGMERRVSNLLETEPTEARSLTEGIPPDVFRSAMNQWFAESPSPSLQAKPLRPMQHLPNGGWMIDERRMAIVYIPRGHADPWLTAWTSLASKVQVKKLRDKREQERSSWGHDLALESDRSIGSGLLSSKHAGQCTECHTQMRHPNFKSQVDLQESMDSIAQWKVQPRSESQRLATRFDHTPHLLIPSLTNCVQCHQLPSKTLDTTSSTQFAKKDPAIDQAHPIGKLISLKSQSSDPHSQFAPMVKANCSDCHRPNGAGDSCTQCHNYHVKP